MDEVEAIGYVLNIAVGSVRDAHVEKAQETLLRLLPLLQAEGSHLLRPNDRENLRLFLMGSHTTLVLAILNALMQVGNADDLRMVRKLEGGGWSGAKQPKVRTTAQACQAALQSRLQQQQLSQMLLRASAGATDPANTLLRAARGTSERSPDDLLRVPNE